MLDGINAEAIDIGVGDPVFIGFTQVAQGGGYLVIVGRTVAVIDVLQVKEIEELTEDIPDKAELSLYDKCDIRIHEIEDDYAGCTIFVTRNIFILKNIHFRNVTKVEYFYCIIL